jgi:hypothetical protein
MTRLKEAALYGSAFAALAVGWAAIIGCRWLRLEFFCP